MSKLSDEDRCQIYEKRGSRQTRCPRPREGINVVDGYDVVICFHHWGYDPAPLEELCREAIKRFPKEESVPEA